MKYFCFKYFYNMFMCSKYILRGRLGKKYFLYIITEMLLNFPYLIIPKIIYFFLYVVENICATLIALLALLFQPIFFVTNSRAYLSKLPRIFFFDKSSFRTRCDKILISACDNKIKRWRITKNLILKKSKVKNHD